MSAGELISHHLSDTGRFLNLASLWAKLFLCGAAEFELPLPHTSVCTFRRTSIAACTEFGGEGLWYECARNQARARTVGRVPVPRMRSKPPA